MGRQPHWTSLEDVACCRAYVRVSEDSVVRTSQTFCTLESRVQGEFKLPVSSVLIKAARVVWLARSGRSVVRRFEALKAACLKYQSKRGTVAVARLSGCAETDAELVAFSLFTGKGTMSTAYDAMKEKAHDDGPAFLFPEALEWMEGSGALFDSGAGILQVMEKNDGSDAPRAGEEEKSEERDSSTPQPSSSLDASISRTIGSKNAKRRKLEEVSSSKLARAVASIAESQRKRIQETTRRNNIALMQSEDVSADLRVESFKRMASGLMQTMMDPKKSVPEMEVAKEAEASESTGLVGD